MRAALILALCLATLGCVPSDRDGERASEGPSAGYVIDDPPPRAPDDTIPESAPATGGGADAAGAAASTEVSTEASTEPETTPETRPTEEAPEEEDVFAPARAACEASGGRFGRAAGGGARVCFRTPEDANTPCRTGADCEGACLARSRTCAPLLPLLGCNEVILSSGRVATECVE